MFIIYQLLNYSTIIGTYHVYKVNNNDYYYL